MLEFLRSLDDVGQQASYPSHQQERQNKPHSNKNAEKANTKATSAESDYTSDQKAAVERYDFGRVVGKL